MMVQYAFELITRLYLPRFLANKDRAFFLFFTWWFILPGCLLTVFLVTLFHVATPLLMVGTVDGGFYAALPESLCRQLIYSCGNSVFFQTIEQGGFFYVMAVVTQGLVQMGTVLMTFGMAFQDFAFIRNASMCFFVLNMAWVIVVGVYVRNQTLVPICMCAMAVLKLSVYAWRFSSCLQPTFLAECTASEENRARLSAKEGVANVDVEADDSDTAGSRFKVNVDRVPALSSVKQLQNPLQISSNCSEDDEGGRSKIIDSGAGSGMEMQVIPSTAAGNADLPMLPDTPEVLPEFDAPEPKAPWRVLSSTSITKLKAAKFGRVDVSV